MTFDTSDLAPAHQGQQGRSWDHCPVVDTDQDKAVGKDAVQGRRIAHDQRSEEVAVRGEHLLLPPLPARLLGHSRSWLMLFWTFLGRRSPRPGLLEQENGGED